MSNITPEYYTKFDFTHEGRTYTLKDYFEYRCGFILGNVGKYLVRYKDKNGIEDLSKALEYLKDLDKNNFWEIKSQEPARLYNIFNTMERSLVEHNYLLIDFLKLTTVCRREERSSYKTVLHELIANIKKECFYLTYADKFPYGWELVAKCVRDFEKNCNPASRESFLCTFLSGLNLKFKSNPSIIDEGDREDAAHLCLYIWQMYLKEYLTLHDVIQDLPELSFDLNSSESFKEDIVRFTKQYELAQITSQYFIPKNTPFDNFICKSLERYTPEFFDSLGKRLGIIKEEE